MIQSDWPKRQLDDYYARQPGTLFADGVKLDEQQGYELQLAVARLREQRGEKIIGYKVGCTSPTIRSQLGIDHSISGHLFDSEQHSSDAILRRDNFANLAIEGELAVVLLREPLETDFASEGIPDCVSHVFPVIELHHHVIRGAHPSAGELIANNAIHAGFVMGTPVARDNVCANLELSIFADDCLIETCAGKVLAQTISSSLQWLSQSVNQRGECLRAGHLVLTGSIPSLIPIREPCQVRVDTGVLGSVRTEFE